MVEEEPTKDKEFPEMSLMERAALKMKEISQNS